jgi:hypothetical protein
MDPNVPASTRTAAEEHTRYMNPLSADTFHPHTQRIRSNDRTHRPHLHGTSMVNT